MDEFEKKEFWEALGRLYSATEDLRFASENLLTKATNHETRPDRVDVLLDALREEVKRLKRRHRQ